MIDTLSVARDALLEQATIADVLDLARTMALERLARGLPVAWVGPVESSATVLHTWLAVSRVGWADIWRDGVPWKTPDGGWLVWRTHVVRNRVQRAACVLDGDATRAAWGA